MRQAGRVTQPVQGQSDAPSHGLTPRVRPCVLKDRAARFVAPYCGCDLDFAGPLSLARGRCQVYSKRLGRRMRCPRCARSVGPGRILERLGGCKGSLGEPEPEPCPDLLLTAIRDLGGASLVCSPENTCLSGRTTTWTLILTHAVMRGVFP